MWLSPSKLPSRKSDNVDMDDVALAGDLMLHQA